MALQLNGFHHVTAIAGDIAANYRFVTSQLGLRLVKRSINQDQVGSWHLFYGDGGGQTGSALTFFDWPGSQGTAGSGAISALGLRIGSHSLDYWLARLHGAGAEGGAVMLARQAGRDVIDVTRPDGLRLQLVADDTPAQTPCPWAASPVPPEHQIRGLAHQTLTVHDRRRSAALFTDVLGIDYLGESEAARGDDGAVHVYRMDAAGSLGEIHLIERSDLPVAGIGGGSVHHMAMCAADQCAMDGWQARLRDFGMNVSSQIDRHYFRSIYFREPGGVLLEIASKAPGYTIDEPLERLGEALALPPHLEPRRAEIEAGLRPFD